MSWNKNLCTSNNNIILELADILHPIIPVSARLPPMIKNIPFFTILPQHICGHRNSSAILAMLKIVIDINTDMWNGD